MTVAEMAATTAVGTVKMTGTDMQNILGRAITPQELGKFLNLDRRTIIKYAARWGGVEVAPGTWRFFENRIMEVLNAEQGFEKRYVEVQGKRDGSGPDAAKTVSGREQKVVSGGAHLGKRSKKGTGEAVIPDKFGIFGNRSMVQ
ncbi:MAG: hypothetical protein ABFD45_11615 [Smithella sp.]